MLLFTFNIDLDGRLESIRDLEQRLTERTGEECLVLSFCTGVYHFPSEKERLDESSQRGEVGRVKNDLSEILEKLAAIESTLQRLPETQAAVFIQMYEEYQTARLQGLKSSDLWVIAPPNSR